MLLHPPTPRIFQANLAPLWSHQIVRLMLAFLCLAASTKAYAKPLNIVVLYADDWRFDTLGVESSGLIQTPNLDRLAARGVRFKNAAATTALCGPSRASMLTGQWMSRHGNLAFSEFKTPWNETFPGILRDNGYVVAHVGKWHCGKFPAERFDFARAYHGQHWITAPDGSKIHVTQQNENDALEFLRSRPADRPFSLVVNFFAPHAEDRHPLQYLPQPDSLGLYAGAPVPVPASATEESFRRLPDFIAKESNEGRKRWRDRFDTPEKYQAMMKNYFRLVTEVDAACGRILAELDRQGVTDSTLIVFTGDNGYLHGEHGLADKWYAFEESIRVPLIVLDPRASSTAGTVRTEWALNVDLAPTLLGAAGMKTPERMQGRDLAALYTQNKVPDWRTDFFYEHPTLRSVDFIPSSEGLVELDWKYIRWPDFGREQLFNLRTDRREENDLAALPEHASRLRTMRARCDQLKQEAQ